MNHVLQSERNCAIDVTRREADEQLRRDEVRFLQTLDDQEELINQVVDRLQLPVERWNGEGTLIFTNKVLHHLARNPKITNSTSSPCSKTKIIEAAVIINEEYNTRVNIKKICNNIKSGLSP